MKGTSIMSSIITTSSSSLSSSTFGFIEVAKPTKKHKAWLEEKGYKVTIEEVEGKVYYKTEVSGFVPEIAVTTDSLKELVGRKAVLSYKTKATVDGAEKKGLHLCWALGPVSALVMKTEDEVRGVKAPKTAHRFDF